MSKRTYNQGNWASTVRTLSFSYRRCVSHSHHAWANDGCDGHLLRQTWNAYHLRASDSGWTCSNIHTVYRSPRSPWSQWTGRNRKSYKKECSKYRFLPRVTVLVSLVPPGVEAGPSPLPLRPVLPPPRAKDSRERTALPLCERS